MGKEKKNRLSEILTILESPDLPTSDISKCISEFLDIMEKSGKISMETFVTFLEKIDQYESRIRYSVNEILSTDKYVHHGFNLIQEPSSVLILDLSIYRNSFLKFSIQTRTDQLESFFNGNNQLILDRYSTRSGLTLREFLFSQTKTELKKIFEIKIHVENSEKFWVNFCDLRCVVGLCRILMIKGLDPEILLSKLEEEKTYKPLDFPVPGFGGVINILATKKDRPEIEKLFTAIIQSARRGGLSGRLSGGPKPRSLKRPRTVGKESPQ